MKKLTKLFTSILCVFMLTGVFSNEVAFATATPNINDITYDSANGQIGLGGFQAGDEEKGQIFNKVLKEYKGVVTFISAIGLVSMILFFIFNLISLGNSKGNPQERQKAITGLIVSGIATAGLGAVNIIVALFYNMIGNTVE